MYARGRERHVGDLTRCGYEEFHPGYTARRERLAEVVTTSEFLWCVPAERGLPYYEQDKLVEWTLRMTTDRILGFVHVERWSEFFDGKDIPLADIYYSPDPPADGEADVLVSYPFRDGEVIRRVQYRFIDPKHADVVADDIF